MEGNLMSIRANRDSREIAPGRRACRVRTSGMTAGITLGITAAILLFLTAGSMSTRAEERVGVAKMAVDAAMRAAIIDTVSTRLGELFLYPEIAVKYEAHLRRRLALGGYDNLATLGEFVNALNEDLLAVYPDGHLEVGVLRERRIGRGREMTDEAWERYVENAAFGNFGFRRVENFPGNIGYLDLRRFEYPKICAETVAAAMKFLAHSDALIIDLRQNPGGRGELLQIIFSYFFEDHRVHYATDIYRSRNVKKQWWTVPGVDGWRMPDVPLYILTSYGTGSAAELFAFSLKHLGRAVVVGDTTAGAAHTTHRYEFPDVHITLNIPTGTTISPVTGTDWEGTGVIPDIDVPPEQAFDVAYSMALDSLMTLAADEHRRFRYDWVKRELDARLNPVKLKTRVLKQYAGQYGTRRIFLKGGELYYHREDRPVYRLIPLGGDLFRLDGLDYFRIAFTRDESGAVTELVGLYDSGERDVSARTGK
jgi:hypothetical protein